MSSKRRSGPASDPDDFLATPDPKRRKRSDETHFPEAETRETTTEIGLRLVRQLKKSQDKNGRNVAIHFLDLPSRAEYPDYYQQTAMPLSLNMIEQRLENFEYENLESLESDLKRMVQNAKDYNNSRSAIFEDAERIRKALSNFMPKHNPAYLRPDYRAYPTPIPQELLDQVRHQSISSEGTMAPERVKLVFPNPAARRRQSQATPSTDTLAETREEVRQEQLKFLQELSEQEDAINFEEKVSKKDYPDYYKWIKKPTSISDVRALVEKDAIQDWDALAKEVRLIWDNAKDYNQEESDIYLMAEKLEAWSESKMQSLGAQPRRNLKLSLSQPKPKALRLTMGSSTPTRSLVGGTIDSESLRRQKEEMGQALSKVRRASSKSTQVNGSTPVPSSAVPSVRRSASLATTTERADTTTAEAKVNGTTSTPEPQEDARASPPPAQTPAQQLPTPVQEVDVDIANSLPVTNGTGHIEPSARQQPSPPTAANPMVSSQNYLNQSVIPMERRYRDPGRGWDFVLLGSVTFMTNPSLPNDPRWKLVRYGSAIKTQTSGFIALPAHYRDLRIIPNTTPELARRRRHRIFFMHNSTVYREGNSNHVEGAFEVRLVPGENVLVVEVLADLRDGEKKEYAPSQLQFDFERSTLIVHLNTA
ncbi:uncharacterized protein Z519_01202 [Cladophialophora bantiana CBS 173.52]|uniref:Bromo domain-containing protein n=1 Tax=Cladophialophora bantiana (strain ATCC 10958 / CBS 173.52 / CDC B-1940 / NIH 8579) TaxID=1442370 RepID=A0A0D2HW91_CLAB1|nr:uncharacterized protein Z519_01202 [Cladophialophora bantiana CBS 173.52]KIW97618.1 hypothetical protein Z519_01202 [Cladophialophora bantiana CBS 173.52]